MDPTAAEASFTEIAFGINVAFAFFTEGKKIHAYFVDGKMRECLAMLKVVEKSENLDVTNDLRDVKKIQERSKRRQHGLFLECVISGVACALVCLWVLLKNDLDVMLPYEELYLVPIAAFLLGSVINTIWFLCCQQHVMRHAIAILPSFSNCSAQ
jgi:sterol desaturase/sphingolipid hydroxylase (fatty acid hydroxylase superfamily)